MVNRGGASLTSLRIRVVVSEDNEDNEAHTLITLVINPSNIKKNDRASVQKVLNRKN